MIDAAQRNGVDVTTEVYPYTAWSTFIGAVIFDGDFTQRQGLGYGDIEVPESGERLNKESFERLRKEAPQTIIVGHGMTVLQEGSYFAVIDLASNLDRDPTADDIKVTPLTVGPGNDDATIPPTDGAIRAGDYLFDVDVAAGGSTVTFTNTSDNQFHFVLLADFGTTDPAALEAAVPVLLTADDSTPPPEGIDPSQVNFDFAASGVMGPGSSGTFDVGELNGSSYTVFLSNRYIARRSSSSTYTPVSPPSSSGSTRRSRPSPPGKSVAATSSKCSATAA